MKKQISPLALLLWTALLIVTNVFPQVPSAKTTRSGQQLELGKPIDREFCVGDQHRYQIPLDAGQFARVLVTPKGPDTKETFFGPTGSKIISLDMGSLGGPETVSLIAEASGTHAIEVELGNVPGNPFAKSKCVPGYTIVLTELHHATPNDELRVDAQKLFADAAQIPSINRHATDYIEKLTQALAKWTAVGDQVLMAGTLADIGFQRKVADWSEAIRCYREALRLYELLDERVGQARLHRLLGTAYRYTGESQKALDHYERSLSLWEGRGDLVQTKLLLDEFQRVYQEMGDWRNVREYFFAAIRVDPRKDGLPFELIRAADISTALGENSKATEERRRATALFEAEAGATGYRDLRILRALTNTYVLLGEKQKAFELIERQVNFEFAPTEPNGLDQALGDAGRVLIRFGEPRKAVEYLERGVKANKENGPPGRLYWLLELLGDAHAAAGEPVLALEAYRSVPEATLSNGHRRIPIQYGIARALRDTGDHRAALIAAEDIIQTNEAVRSSIIGIEQRRTFAAAANLYYQFYIDLLMLLDKANPGQGYAAKAIQTAELARARSLIESFSEARSDLRGGVEQGLLEREKAARIKLNSVAERQARLLATKYIPKQASELNEELNRSTLDLDAVNREIRRSSPRYAALTQPQPLTVAEIQRDLLDANTVLLEYAVGNERSHFWWVEQEGLKAYELPKRAEIEAAALKVHGLLQNQKRWSEDRNNMVAEYAEAAQKLSDMILGPVAEQIKGKRLVIVADGALQYIPFSALPQPKRKSDSGANVSQPLAITNEIVSLPSASVLSVLRREASSRKPKGDGIMVVADPVFSETDERLANNGIPVKKTDKADRGWTALQRVYSFSAEENKPFSMARLPFTRREAESIFAAASKSSSLKALDFDANREKLLKADLSKYRIVHFATHDILHSEHPDLSGIVLSLVNEEGEPVNGFLRLNEIFNMNLNADLVVLSACQTALGKEVRGEGLIGLTRGFMYAGTPRVVASLWKVDDVATAELMKIFYQKMLKEKMRPAAALRAAKIEMSRSKRWSAPYYWAAFELQGDWR